MLDLLNKRSPVGFYIFVSVTSTSHLQTRGLLPALSTLNEHHWRAYQRDPHLPPFKNPISILGSIYSFKFPTQIPHTNEPRHHPSSSHPYNCNKDAPQRTNNHQRRSTLWQKFSGALNLDANGSEPTPHNSLNYSSKLRKIN